MTATAVLLGLDGTRYVKRPDVDLPPLLRTLRP